MNPSNESFVTSSPARADQRQEPPEPNAAQVIATFANVDQDIRAPVTDEAICQCASRPWGQFEVKLVPFGYAALMELDCSTIEEALEEARRGDVFLVAISHPKFGGLFAIMTFPRPREPWVGLKLTDEKWYTRGDRPPNEFGFDQNLACELRFLCIQFLIRNQATIFARPRPQMALEELEARYASILAEATEPLMIDRVDVSTWARFLEQARNAVRTCGWRRNGNAPGTSPQQKVFDLAHEAWPIHRGS